MSLCIIHQACSLRAQQLCIQVEEHCNGEWDVSVTSLSRGSCVTHCVDAGDIIGCLRIKNVMWRKAPSKIVEYSLVRIPLSYL